MLYNRVQPDARTKFLAIRVRDVIITVSKTFGGQNTLTDISQNIV